MISEKVSLSDELAETLSQWIFRELKAGDRLPPEIELAKSYGVSRSTMRESLKILTAEGMITRSREGTFISEKVKESLIKPLSLMVNMEVGNIRNLIELRKILETAAISAAAERANQEWIEEMKRIQWKMKEPGISMDRLQNLDIEFHNTIARATGNGMLTELLNAIRCVIARNLENSEALVPIYDDTFDLHERLIEAISLHDKEKACATLERYFEVLAQSEVFDHFL